MSRYRKLGVIALVVLTISLVSAFIGGSIGFLQGYSYAIGDTGARSFTLTADLRALRKGEIEAGITSLESELDSSIISHWATTQDGPPILSWIVRSMGIGKYDRKFFGTVARYRAEYPSTTPDPNVREAIASHLRTFDSTDVRQ
jgi:hypothetical protein